MARVYDALKQVERQRAQEDALRRSVSSKGGPYRAHSGFWRRVWRESPSDKSEAEALTTAHFSQRLEQLAQRVDDMAAPGNSSATLPGEALTRLEGEVQCLRAELLSLRQAVAEQLVSPMEGLRLRLDQIAQRLAWLCVVVAGVGLLALLR